VSLPIAQTEDTISWLSDRLKEKTFSLAAMDFQNVKTHLVSLKESIQFIWLKRRARSEKKKVEGRLTYSTSRFINRSMSIKM
jgi:hypothetical protein